MAKVHKKQDRTSVLVGAVLIATFLSAWGFKGGNPLFVWQLPLAIVAAGAAWTWWPRSNSGLPAGEDA
ncbi:MAG TPA: hypothetical protein VLA62_00930 [Solirubrobacterales bacterium]|nr:hypothetical protein [Solirubrobacterales bacterium]